MIVINMTLRISICKMEDINGLMEAAVDALKEGEQPEIAPYYVRVRAHSGKLIALKPCNSMTHAERTVVKLRASQDYINETIDKHGFGNAHLYVGVSA